MTDLAMFDVTKNEITKKYNPFDSALTSCEVNR